MYGKELNTDKATYKIGTQASGNSESSLREELIPKDTKTYVKVIWLQALTNMAANTRTYSHGLIGNVGTIKVTQIGDDKIFWWT